MCSSELVEFRCNFFKIQSQTLIVLCLDWGESDALSSLSFILALVDLIQRVKDGKVVFFLCA